MSSNGPNEGEYGSAWQAQWVQSGHSAAHPLKGKSPHGGWTAAPPFLTRYIVWFVLSPVAKRGKGPLPSQVFSPSVPPLSDHSNTESTGRSSDFPRSIFCETEMCMRPELQHDSTLSGLIYRKLLWQICMLKSKIKLLGHGQSCIQNANWIIVSFPFRFPFKLLQCLQTPRWFIHFPSPIGQHSNGIFCRRDKLCAVVVGSVVCGKRKLWNWYEIVNLSMSASSSLRAPYAMLSGTIYQFVPGFTVRPPRRPASNVNGLNKMAI